MALQTQIEKKMEVISQRKRIAFYYQTFTRHDNCLEEIDKRVTDLYISSIHFGFDLTTKKPYMHLNDHPTSYFKELFDDLDKLTSKCRVHIMIGGAGGGLSPLIQKPIIYMPMLRCFLRFQTRITGINLDVEEPDVTTSDVQQLITNLHTMLPGYELSLSPIASPASFLSSSFFSLEKFIKTEEASWVKTYLIQMYSDFSCEALESYLSDYPKIKYTQVLVGTLSDQFKYRMNDLHLNYKQMLQKHPDLGGIFDWEMFDAPNDWVDTVAACTTKPTTENVSMFYNENIVSYCTLL